MEQLFWISELYKPVALFEIVLFLTCCVWITVALKSLLLIFSLLASTLSATECCRLLMKSGKLGGCGISKESHITPHLALWRPAFAVFVRVLRCCSISCAVWAAEQLWELHCKIYVNKFLFQNINAIIWSWIPFTGSLRQFITTFKDFFILSEDKHRTWF